MSLISILITGGGVLLLIGLIADWTLPSKTDPQDWDTGPSPNPWALISYLSAFLFLFLGFFSILLFSTSILSSTETPKGGTSDSRRCSNECRNYPKK